MSLPSWKAEKMTATISYLKESADLLNGVVDRLEKMDTAYWQESSYGNLLRVEEHLRVCRIHLQREIKRRNDAFIASSNSNSKLTGAGAPGAPGGEADVTESRDVRNAG